jgi:PAS domain S-box-containing protein
MSIVKKLITSYKSQIQKTKASPYLLIPLVIIFCFSVIASIAADAAPLKEITVVLDDNYPPYIFRDEKGHLQGILVDEWRLWEEKTEIKADLRGMDWDKAVKTMAEGNAQVIDTIFFTEERTKTLAFSAPYTSIDVPIFFHRDISGITDVKSLHGFTIGVKAGDACIDFLKRHDILTLREYPSYDSIIRNAAEQKIRVFCIDSPPAHYYLYKMNLEQQYRYTAPLYTGQLRRAVHKERKDLLKVVEDGFAKISQKEHKEIEKRWIGFPIAGPYLTGLFYLIGVLVILGAILLLWNYTLRRKVNQKTVQLREAFKTLEKSEENYRELVMYSPAGIYEVDYETNLFTRVNDVICEYTGYTRDELLTMNFFNLFTEESRKLMLARLENLMANENIPQTVEYCIRTKGGEEIWILLNSRYIYEAGKLKGATGVIYNITDRKQAEKALRESEERYRIIAENTADTIAIFDLNFNPTYISPSILKLRGYPAQEAMTLTLDQTLTPDSLQQASKMFADQMALESSGTADPARTALIDLEEYCKDGSTIWVELAVSFLRDNNFKPTGMLTVTRNITERKLAEGKLQQTLESLKKAVGATIQVMVSAVEMRDPYTAGHQHRSADLARAIATEMGLPQDKIDGIRLAGSIHDIGKLSIPAEILSKPTKLTNLEFSLIKEHSRIGYEMLKDVESPWPLAQIVYQHHERMDGSGYPQGLKGDEILMEARIMAVADVVESMASHRPYRPALGIEAALEEIEKNKGILYDADAVNACLRLFREKSYQLK